MTTETPETHKAWQEALSWCEKRNESHDPHHAALANLAEKLERERDEARRLAFEYRRVWEKVSDAVDETPNYDPLPWEIKNERP